MDEYIEHSLCKLDKMTILVTETADRAPFEVTENAVISIQLYLQRKPLFFMFRFELCYSISIFITFRNTNHFM